MFGTSAFALDPQKAITQFVHTSWTEKDGAPPGIVALAQTTDGYLWIGTMTGLFRFDGLRFVRFEPQAGESLPGVRVFGLLATPDGALWISSGTRVWCRLFNGHLSKPENIPPAYQLVEAPDGTLVAGTGNGLWRLKDGVWKDVSKEWNFLGRLARQIYFDKSGTLWVVTEDRVVYRPAGQSQFIDAEQLPGYAQLSNFAEAPDGTMWISEVTRSAHSLLRKGERGPITEVRVGASWVLFDRSGSLWVGSGGDGLRRVAHPGKINGRQVAQFGPEAEQFTVKEGLSGNIVIPMLEDREGNIWVGTFKGLDRFRESSFFPVAIDQPETPRFFHATRDASLLVVGANAVDLLRIDPLGNREVLAHYLDLRSICEDETGVIWGVRNQLLLRYQQGRFVTVLPPSEVVLSNYGSMVCDQAGGIWLYDRHGNVLRLANGTLIRVLDNPEAMPIWGHLYADRKGRIWIGQPNRVRFYEHGKWQVFGNNDGVPAGMISAFHMDRAGNVWAGGDRGLSKFENGHFRSLSLPARSVYGIAEDDYGCLWLASDSGVLRVPIAELDRSLADSTYLLRYESFDLLDGLPGKPQSMLMITGNTIARTPDGRIWFATSNGIAYVDPRRIPKNNLPPPVQVESLSAGGRDYAAWDTVKLPARTTSLQLTYTALSLTIPERVRFRFKLEGVENEWQEVGTRRTTSYSNLGPGDYRFRVIACNNDGVWNEVGATLSFSILPAWYQTIWFRMLYVLLALFAIWLLYRLRLRQVARAMSVRFDERLAERTRIARELHDTLLQTVQGSKLVADDALDKSDDSVPVPVRHALEQLSKWLGQATQEGRAALNSLRTSSTDSNDLAAALRRATEECVIDSSIVVTFSASGGRREMDPVARDEIYRIGYEAIRNACEHAAASELEIALIYAQDLTLSVRDNGVGMAPVVVSEGRAGHFGLQGMRERAERIGSKFTMVSAPNSGTEMTLLVPGKVIFRKPHASRFERVRNLFRRGRGVSDLE